MNKRLLFVFLSIFACNSVSLIANKMDKQEALYFLPQTLVITCDNRFTDECSFIAQHLKKASQLQKEKAAIKKLEKESEQLTDQPDLQAPIQKELEKARTECPNHDKLYWNTLSREEKREIAKATRQATLGSSNRAVVLQEVWEALYR
jgi:hypothetical protein